MFYNYEQLVNEYGKEKVDNFIEIYNALDMRINYDKYYVAGLLGLDGLYNQLIEEMGELTQAICKRNRLNGVGQPISEELTEEIIEHKIIEEMADVQAVIDELMYLKQCKKQMEDITDEKMVRTLNRIENKNK